MRNEGRWEFFRYGYLTLDFAPHDPETIYYISGHYAFRDGYEPTAEERLRELTTGSFPMHKGGYDKMLSYLTFVSYHLPSGEYTDHGVIRLKDGRYPTNTQSIAAHPNGRIYTCPWIEKPDWKKGDAGPRQQCDLISFESPVRGR